MGGPGDGDVFGLRGLGVVFVRVGRDHQFAIADAALGQRQLDHALARLRIAGDDGPIGLLRAPLGEGARQPGRRVRRLAEQQHARGIAVEPVHQPRPLQPLAPGRQQPVHVLGGLGAALDRQARGLVQRQHVLVLVEHQGLGVGDVARRQALAFPLAARLGVGQGRHAHHIAGLEPCVRLGARAVDPHLTRPEQLLQLDMVQVRPAPLEPAVEPDPRLALAHHQGFDFTRRHGGAL